MKRRQRTQKKIAEMITTLVRAWIMGWNIETFKNWQAFKFCMALTLFAQHISLVMELKLSFQ